MVLVSWGVSIAQGQVCLDLWVDASSTISSGKVKNLNTTNDRETGEKSHGASNQTELALKLDLHVSLYLVVGGRVKEDVDKLKRWTG